MLVIKVEIDFIFINKENKLMDQKIEYVMRYQLDK